MISNFTLCHPELVSGSHREPFFVLHRGQMLKQVQHDVLWAMSYEFFWDKRTKDHKSSQLKARNSLLKAVWKDGKLNSRGLLSPRFFNDHIIKASAKTPFERWVMSCERWAVWKKSAKISPRSSAFAMWRTWVGDLQSPSPFPVFQTHFYVDTIKPEAWKPPAIYVRVF